MKRESLEQIVSTVPAFRNRWESFLKESEPEGEPLWYVGMSELAHFVVDSFAHGETNQLPNLFAEIERTLQNADPEFENLIAAGLFEDIQNIASHREFGPAVFRQWLGDRSQTLWDQIDEGMQRVAAWEQQQRPKWWQFWRRRETLDVEKALSQVESPELKRIIEANYRKAK